MISPNSTKKEQDRNLEELNYPASEDIFSQEPHVSMDENGIPQTGDYDSEMIDDGMEMDLDVPGAELDDAQEIVGSEDEENNYWSLGGDAHEDLEQSEDF